MTFISNATTIHHKVSFELDLEIDTVLAIDSNVYTTVSMSDCSFSAIEGAPQLPVKIIQLIIPSDQEVDMIQLTKGKGEMLSLTYPVLPIQKPVPTQIDFKGNVFVGSDKSIYKTDGFYPLQQAKILRTNFIRGNKVVVVEVSPVFYNPVSSQLEYFESMDINLHLKSSKKKIKSSKVKNSNSLGSFKNKKLTHLAFGIFK